MLLCLSLTSALLILHLAVCSSFISYLLSSRTVPSLLLHCSLLSHHLFFLSFSSLYFTLLYFHLFFSCPSHLVIHFLSFSFLFLLSPLIPFSLLSLLLLSSHSFFSSFLFSLLFSTRVTRQLILRIFCDPAFGIQVTECSLRQHCQYCDMRLLLFCN